MDRTIFLKRLQGLAALDAAARDALATAKMAGMKFKRLQLILKDDQQPDYLFAVLDGWAARYSLRPNGTRRITGLLLPGDFCGIHAITCSKMDHSIVALTRCEVGMIEASLVNELVAAHPSIGLAVWRSKLIEEAILRRARIATGDAERSLAHLLCELFERTRPLRPPTSTKMDIPMTQEEIGDTLGLTCVHTNRTIRALRERGLLTVQGKEFHVLDLKGLQSLGGFNPNYLHQLWQSPSE